MSPRLFADYLNGGGGSDELLGLGGPDELLGGTGNDMLQGGAGFDMLDGGRGVDTPIDAGEAENRNRKLTAKRSFCAP